MKYALIMGAMSGLAQASIKVLKEHDYEVFAADISIKEIKVENQIHYLPCDVTNNDLLKQVYDYVSSKTTTLDVVSNFAGIVTLGSFVERDLNALTKILEINTISTYKINNLFFPLIKNGNGRYIVISSEYARIDPIPFHGYYTLSKHALDVYIDSLRRELLGQGIKVVGIRPGAFKTNMQGGIQSQFTELLESTKIYKKPLLKMKYMMDRELDKTSNIKKFEKVFSKALLKNKPKRFYNVGNSFKMKLYTSFPRSLQDLFFKTFFK